LFGEKKGEKKTKRKKNLYQADNLTTRGEKGGGKNPNRNAISQGKKKKGGSKEGKELHFQDKKEKGGGGTTQKREKKKGGKNEHLFSQDKGKRGKTAAPQAFTKEKEKKKRRGKRG